MSVITEDLKQTHIQELKDIQSSIFEMNERAKEVKSILATLDHIEKREQELSEKDTENVTD